MLMVTIAVAFLTRAVDDRIFVFLPIGTERNGPQDIKDRHKETSFGMTGGHLIQKNEYYTYE